MDFAAVLEQPFLAIKRLFAIKFVNCLPVVILRRLITNPTILDRSILLFRARQLTDPDIGVKALRSPLRHEDAEVTPI
jgi:hypothetical protein